jgi:tetratricopeptide (TPR) repeat protein
MAAQLSNARLCVCGSGLSATRCCRLNIATLGSPEAGRHLAPLEEQAAAAQRAGNTEEAERLALDVLELGPARTQALSVLYAVRKAQQNVRAAIALIRRVAELEPNKFWATNELCLLLLGQGDAAGALRSARNAVRIAPENAQSHYLLGMALTETHNLGRRIPLLAGDRALRRPRPRGTRQSRAVPEEPGQAGRGAGLI